MKIVLALLTLAISATSFAGYTTECQQTEKIKCTVEYNIRTAEKLVTEKVISSSGYELVNWDEPSLAYCEASVGFNQNDIYVLGSMNSQKQITVAIRHAGAGTSATSSKGAAVSTTASFSPGIEVTVNGVTGTLQTATARCNVSR
jgi:hypothetical protein